MTAAFLSPENKVGRVFWDRVYGLIKEKYGTADVPLDTINKIWITPGKAVVHEHDGAAMVLEARLKVMLEVDHQASADLAVPAGDRQDLPRQIMREVVVPAIEEEVNNASSFAILRQVYHSLILAAWYKRKIRESILARQYVDQGKVAGLQRSSACGQKTPDDIYKDYIAAYHSGLKGMVVEVTDSDSGEVIPRQYATGGFSGDMSLLSVIDDPGAAAAQAVTHEGNSLRLAVLARRDTPQVVQSPSDSAQGAVRTEKVWTTSTPLSHDPARFTYMVKFNKSAAAFLRSNAVMDPYYSFSVVSEGHLGTFDNKMFGYAFDVPDEDILVALKHMHRHIGTLEGKSTVLLKDFVARHRAEDPANVLYARTDGRPLDITPRQVVDGPVLSGNDPDFLDLNEIIVAHRGALLPNAVVLAYRNEDRLFFKSELRTASFTRPDIFEQIWQGLPIIIAAKRDADTEMVENVLLKSFPGLKRLRPGVLAMVKRIGKRRGDTAQQVAPVMVRSFERRLGEARILPGGGIEMDRDIAAPALALMGGLRPNVDVFYYAGKDPRLEVHLGDPVVWDDIVANVFIPALKAAMTPAGAQEVLGRLASRTFTGSLKQNGGSLVLKFQERDGILWFFKGKTGVLTIDLWKKEIKGRAPIYYLNVHQEGETPAADAPAENPAQAPGGIDLDTSKVPLDIRGGGADAASQAFAIQPIGKITGIYPVVVSIHPAGPLTDYTGLTP